MSRILLIDAHPQATSLCAALAHSYAQGASERGGVTVRTLALRDMQFDPILRVGYDDRQALEPDLQMAQAAIEAADHVVIVTPLWWGSVPALLKGFFDRTLEKGWAYRYTEKGMPEGLLAGRSARVVMTSDSPGWYLRLFQGNPTQNQLVRSTLKFCGFKPVGFTRIGPVHSSTQEQRARWLQEVERVAEKDARQLQPTSARTANA
ncbi:NAD(P)H-dependent oxidoreductase [Hydrogenophaga sp. 5NK40-0174]|uniref:NAD(P)H-dependent oxidoreductase n=1 Tax=Hydrogenophaga sp. 5NK40-0174 TaxID=3127649 RepID=UPI003103FB42